MNAALISPNTDILTPHHIPGFSSLPPTVRFTNGECRIFRSRELDPRTGRPITVSRWAELYGYVSEPPLIGPWRNENSPYAVEPMDCWNIPSVREIYLCFAPQIVKTRIAFNCLGYALDQEPGPIMYVMPDSKLAGRIAENRIAPMIRTTPRLAGLLIPGNDAVTKHSIRFVNGINITMAWATSVSELSSDPVRYIFADEVAKYRDYSGSSGKKEASPFNLIRQRQNAFKFTRKLLALSSPGAAPCKITALLKTEADEVRRYAARCPICGADQIMEDENIVALNNCMDPRRIIREKLGRYGCASCGIYWDEYLRDKAVLAGHWITGAFDPDGEWHPAPPLLRPVSVGFHLPAWYSLNSSLSDVVAARIKGEDGPDLKMVYVTQYRAEEYKEVVTSSKVEIILRHRTKIPAGIAPAGTIALTCGIDSHTWGYRFTVLAWVPKGRDFDCHKILHGHMGTLNDVEKLVFESRYQVENSSQTFPIWRTAIDTGGGKKDEGDKTMTDEIYNWLRSVPPGVIYGVKGASQRQESRVKYSTVDKFPHSGKPIPGGLELRILDTHQFKSLLHWRLSRTEEEDHRIYFDSETGSDFAHEVLAEEKRRLQNGHTEWVKVRRANHYLDTMVYAMACADGQWQPSLKILAPSALNPAPPAVEVVHPSRSEHSSRPQMSSIRERLAGRLGRR